MGPLTRLPSEFWSSLQSGQLPALGYWNYLLLALFTAIEGPVATLLGAAAASAGWMRLDLVFVAAGTGNLTADTLWYGLGYTGRIEWLFRYGRWLGVRRRHLTQMQRVMNKHAPKLLLIAKLTNAFIIPSLIAAGLAHIPWRRWFPSLLVGEVVWTGSLVLIGYYTTTAIQQVERDVRYLAVIASGIFLLALLWWIRRVLQHGQETDASIFDSSDLDER